MGDALADALAAIQAELRSLGARIQQVEQPNPPQQPPRRQPRAPTPSDHGDDPSDEEEVEEDHAPRPRRAQFQEDQNRRGEVKLQAPTFAGKVNPEAYLEWEGRMEHIFAYYAYNDARKVSLAAAQLTENALAWWDRDVAERRRHRHDQISLWPEMKYLLRKRYVPAYYHRDLQKRFRQLTQGGKSVEDYYEEFETLKNRLEVEDSPETLMAQFLDGLQERISRKVERQPYHDLDELVHLAVQAEHHIKRKVTSSYGRSKTPWVPPTKKYPERSTKPAELEVRNKKATLEPARTSSRPEASKTPVPTRARDITCFKCQGKGHYARECPNRRVMILTASGYESLDEEEEAEQEESDEDVMDYAEAGPLLVTRRSLSTLFAPETIQRENIFHTRCSVHNKVCSLIIDGGSCTNVASRYLVDKLKLTRTKHPHPYKLKWLNDETELKIREQVTVPFTIGKYNDEVICDVVPMEAGHLLLGRPWQFDKEVTHNGKNNQYSFTHQNKKHNLVPLTPQEVHDMQPAMVKGKEVGKSVLYVTPSTICKSLEAHEQVPLMIFKENVVSGKDMEDVPAEDKEPDKWMQNAHLNKMSGHTYKWEPPGKSNIFPMLNATDPSSFGADDPILRTESLQEGGDDVDSPSCPTGFTYKGVKLPTKGDPPWPRPSIKNSREEFNQPVEPRITLLDHEELKGRLLQQKITRETPMEAHGQETPSKPSNVKEAGIQPSTSESASLQASKNEEKFTSHVGLLPKKTQVPKLPVLEGRRENSNVKQHEGRIVQGMRDSPSIRESPHV